jgi:hypothetical protein
VVSGNKNNGDLIISSISNAEKAKEANDAGCCLIALTTLGKESCSERAWIAHHPKDCCLHFWYVIIYFSFLSFCLLNSISKLYAI